MKPEGEWWWSPYSKLHRYGHWEQLDDLPMWVAQQLGPETIIHVWHASTIWPFARSRSVTHRLPTADRYFRVYEHDGDVTYQQWVLGGWWQ